MPLTGQLLPNNPFPLPQFEGLGLNPTPCYVVGQPVERYLTTDQIRATLYDAFRSEGFRPDTNYLWQSDSLQFHLSGYDPAAAMGYLVYVPGMRRSYALYSPEYQVRNQGLPPFSSAWMAREFDRVKRNVEGPQGVDAIRPALVETLRNEPEALPPYLSLLDKMAAYEPYDQNLFRKLVILTRLLPVADPMVDTLLQRGLQANPERWLNAVCALGDHGWAVPSDLRSPYLYDIALQVAQEAPTEPARWAELDELRREMNRRDAEPITPALLRRYLHGDRTWWVARRAARVAALAEQRRNENPEVLTREELEYWQSAFPDPALLVLQRGHPYTRIVQPRGWSTREADQQTIRLLGEAVRSWIRYVRMARTE